MMRFSARDATMSATPVAPPLTGGCVEIRTTFPSRSAAEACAERLVRERLAACVQVEGPVSSTYAWQGQVERADEWRCSCKTTQAAQTACIAAIVSAHEYRTPQVVVAPLTATPAYAAWITETVRSG